MTEKTAKQIEEMKKQTFGVEIETAGLGRKEAAQLIARYYGTENTVSYAGNGYDTWICQDNKGRTWQAMKDSSVRAINGKMAEVVTPILTYEDMEDLQEISRKLRRAGAVSNPDYGCGVHIHIGANGQTAKSLRNLANIMASHEELIAKALDLSHRRMSQYCQTVDRGFLQRVNRKKPESMSDLAEIWYGDRSQSHGHYHNSRYHMLNLHATFTKGTIEYRLFQFDNPHDGKKGGIHAGQLKSYIQLCLALSQMAKMVRSASHKPQQNENPRFALRTWLLRLGFIGEEFATARKIFLDRLEGDTAFRFGKN